MVAKVHFWFSFHQMYLTKLSEIDVFRLGYQLYGNTMYCMNIRILPKDMSSLLFPEIGLNHVLGINARCYAVIILFLNTHPAFHFIY